MLLISAPDKQAVMEIFERDPFMNQGLVSELEITERQPVFGTKTRTTIMKLICE